MFVPLATLAVVVAVFVLAAGWVVVDWAWRSPADARSGPDGEPRP